MPSVVARASLVAVGLAVGASLGCGGGPGPDEPVAQTSAADTFPNDQAAYDYFVGKGLTSYQAAGIVGNLDQESGVDPTAVQSGGPGRGIAQWSVGGRWDTDANDNAVWYAGQQGQNVESLQLQLDFIWYELTTFSGYGLAALKASTDVTGATIAFETDFEGCGTCDQSQRIAYAENVLSVFGGDAGPAPDASADAGLPSCTVPGVGTGVCILTSACAAMPDHVSTPGYCPGPADEECCTGPAGDGGSEKDAGDGGDGGGKPAGGDAGSAQDGSSAPVDDARPASGSGCATTPGAATGSVGGFGLVGLAGIAIGRRRHRCARAEAPRSTAPSR